MHLARGPVLFALFAFAAGLLAGACSGSASVVPSVAGVTASPPTVSPVPSQTAAGSGGSPGSSAFAITTGTAGSSQGTQASSGSAFEAIQLATAIVPGPQATPDPSSFTSAYSPSSPAFIVDFELAPDASGTITFTATFGGQAVVDPISHDFSAGWHYFKLDASGAWPSGVYQATLTYAPTGETRNLQISVTANGGSASGSGTDAFTLLRLSTSTDTSGAEPDPSNFTDSYRTSSPAFNVNFELADGLTGTVTCTFTKDGQAITSSPISIDYSANVGWGNFELDSPGTWKTGDFLATLTYVRTGESVTITIPVN